MYLSAKTKNKRDRSKSFGSNKKRDIPVPIKSLFKIINKKQDLENYKYLLSSFIWNDEERVTNFTQLVLIILDLICPSLKYCDFINKNIIVISDKETLGCWAKTQQGETRFLNLYFSIEGIKKSPGFCFNMILSQLILRMHRQLLNGTIKEQEQGIYGTRRGSWCISETKKRLGIENINLEEELRYFDNKKHTGPTFVQTKKVCLKT